MDDDILRCAEPTNGALVAVFIAATGAIVLRVEISEGMANVDELFLRHLVMLTADVGVPGVAFVVSRTEGRPTRSDRLLGKELRSRLESSSTALVDLAVVGQRSWWSAKTGRSTPLASAA